MLQVSRQSLFLLMVAVTLSSASPRRTNIWSRKLQSSEGEFPKSFVDGNTDSKSRIVRRQIGGDDRITFPVQVKNFDEETEKVIFPDQNPPVLRQDGHEFKVNENESTKCTRLSDCKYYQWILKNIGNLPEGFQISKPTLLQHLRNQTCGFDEDDPNESLVLCPMGEEAVAETESEDYTDADATNEFETSFGPRSGIENLENQIGCSGTLVIYHLPESFERDGRSSNVFIFDELKTLNLNSNKNIRYPKLGENKLKGRQVQNVRIDGNCCWKMYKKFFYQGDDQLLIGGDEGRPYLQPKSASTFECK